MSRITHENPALIDGLIPQFPHWDNLILQAMFLLAFPQQMSELRGLWNMAAYDNALSQVGEISGHNRVMTANNTPTPDRYGNLGIISFASASSERLNVVDASWNSITGRFSVGGWWYFDDAASGTETMFCKWDGGVTDNAWHLYRHSTGEIRFQVSSDGTPGTIVTLDTGGVTFGAGEWVCATAEFDPSTRMRLVVNGVEYETTSSVPASCFDSTADLEIAAFGGGGGGFLNGDCGAAWLIAGLLQEHNHYLYYRLTRKLFGHT